MDYKLPAPVTASVGCLLAAAVQESLHTIDDVERLRRIGQRILDVAIWKYLFETT